MSNSLRKISTISRLKTFLMLRNMNLMLMPLMSIGFVVLMKAIMPKGAMGNTLHPYLLTFGLLFSIVMGGIMMACYPLAEEKEKHTLRVLMTSSVSSSEFFIGSLLPTFVLVMIVNLILVPLSGASYTGIQMGWYLLMTIVTTLTSLIIGLIVGLYSRTQMQAGINCTPISLIVMFVPIIGQLVPKVTRFMDYLYSGILVKFVYATTNYSYQGSWQDVLVLLVWLFGTSAIFLVTFKRRGFAE